MKAFTFKRYGASDVLNPDALEKPKPKANQILVKIRATSVTAGDWRIRSATPFPIRFHAGLLKPKNTLLGHEFAGVVEEVGTDVSEFQVGDRIFGSLGMNSGTYAEYVVVDSELPLAKIPEGLSFEEAAVVPVGFLSAYYFLQKVNLQPGMNVLIHGVSGSVGSAMLQLAKVKQSYVVGVCSSRNASWVKKLGADQVISYEQEDFTQIPEKFDLIINAVGKTSYREVKHLLKSTGKYLSNDASLSDYLDLFTQTLSGKKEQILLGIADQKKTDLKVIQSLLAEKKISPYLDRVYSFEEIPAAHAYVEKGRKAGNVAIKVA
ncbi:NAD(P)-dependent alcohol dehydrogenase [Algoriphagus sp. CAU 1675]|uniref:NAD(P)-dependent alcohol dehydrogenase n=1 Tax=Algoriphagus sp. CAU 1675 TaxID=3032597 RepID=UPI0023DB9756|nr:NAD(P)-dependent alcohol dehydrogenase [Algoriphagus sp. CAU 1675]MDF2157108.1 NAD(P)-dependent alcohol dehydrogenase [Algoriphagus sp. CAU 1675]